MFWFFNLKTSWNSERRMYSKMRTSKDESAFLKGHIKTEETLFTRLTWVEPWHRNTASFSLLLFFSYNLCSFFFIHDLFYSLSFTIYVLLFSPYMCYITLLGRTVTNVVITCGATHLFFWIYHHWSELCIEQWNMIK